MDMIKTFYKILIGSLIGVFLLAACSAVPSVPDERVKALEEKVNSLEDLQTQLSAVKGEIDALKSNQADAAKTQTALEALSTQVAKLESDSQTVMNTNDAAHAAPILDGSAADPFELGVAQFVMDSAGFHDMVDEISATRQIDPAYLVAVNRAYKVLSRVIWPVSLAEQGQSFVALLQDFAAALEANNVTDATQLSDRVHAAQHDLSHALDGWKATAVVSSSTSGSPFALSIAQFVLDTSGFHIMAETIPTTKQIDPAYLGSVNRAAKVLSQIAWPEPLNEQGQSFIALLKDFSAALEAENVADATELSAKVHDAQHALSQGIDDWFGEMSTAHMH
jgi:hypothetical protein